MYSAHKSHKHSASDSSGTTSSSSADMEAFFDGFERDMAATEMTPPSSRSTSPDVSVTVSEVSVTTAEIGYQMVCQNFSININQLMNLNFFLLNQGLPAPA